MAERDSDGGWRILEPNPTIKAFHRLWDRVAEALAGLLNEHTVLEAPTDWAVYGFEPPALNVSCTLYDGAVHHLQFGELEPTQRHRYARLDDGPLFLVSTDAFFELNRSLLDLRHRFLVADRESPLRELEFAWIWTDSEADADEDAPAVGDESVVIRVTRESAQTPWRMTVPVNAPADYEAVQALADDIQFAISNEFIDNPEDLGDYGLRPPRARISIRDSINDGKQTIWIGAVDDSPDRKGLFVRREGEDAVRILDGHVLNLLPRGPFEWRDLRLLTRRIADISRLEYVGSNDGFVLEKTDTGGWRLSTPDFEHVNEFAVSGYLRFFKEIKGEDFVEEQADRSVLDSPEARIKLRYDNGDEAEIVIVADSENPDNYLAVQDSGDMVRLSASTAQMLLTSSDTFRSREIMRFVKSEVESLRFILDDVSYHIALRHGKWTLLEPETKTLHNQADVDLLLDAMTPLHVVGVVSHETPDMLDHYGLDTPVFSVEIFLSTPGALHDQSPLTLAIGGPNPENQSERFAQTNTRDGVYRISQEVMDEIRESMRGIR